MKLKSLFGLALGVGLALSSTVAQADDFPSKPITFIVPYAPGGISDLAARAIGASLEKSLGQPVLVVNKPSPGLVLGLSEIKNAEPDGYTIGMWNNTSYVFPLAMKQEVPYDGIEDFTFLHAYGEYVLGTVVQADSPFQTFEDLMEAGKAAPDGLKYGTIGLWSPQHVQFEAAAKHFGVEFVHIPQTGGPAGIANLLGGHLDFLSDASAWASNVKQGQMRILAITGTERNPFFPDVPTYKELGVEEEFWGLAGIAGPAGIPDDIKAKLEAAIVEALKDPAVQEAVASIAQPITSIPGAELEAWAAKDRALWTETLAGQ